jgi:hypothetical protein
LSTPGLPLIFTICAAPVLIVKVRLSAKTRPRPAQSPAIGMLT